MLRLRKCHRLFTKGKIATPRSWLKIRVWDSFVKSSKKGKNKPCKNDTSRLIKTFSKFRDPAKIFRDLLLLRYHSPSVNRGIDLQHYGRLGFVEKKCLSGRLAIRISLSSPLIRVNLAWFWGKYRLWENEASCKWPVLASFYFASFGD